MHLAERIAKQLCKLAGVVFAGTLFACTAESMRPETAAANAAGDGLAVELSVIKNPLAASDSMELLFTLKNLTSATVQVLPWGTPLENELSAHLFQVSVNGEVLQFQGRMVKRAAPKPADYIVLDAGNSISRRVNLSAAYDVSASGIYRVLFSPPGGMETYTIDGHSVFAPTQPVMVERL